MHRRPHLPLMLMVLVLAAAFATGTAVLCRLLMAEPAWPVPVAVGVLLGALLLVQVWSGSTVRVSGHGDLVYRLRGIDLISVPLDRIAGFIPVRTGALIGVGVRCPTEAVRFLSRKGPSLRQVEAWQRHLGVALVLEHLTAEDLTALEDLRVRR